MATKQAVFGSAGSRNRFSTPVSIGITMGANEYPSGTISFDNISPSGAYWYNASGTMQHTETFYLCDSAGNNKVELFTLTIQAGSSNSGIGKSATISAANGKKLKGKALYLVATNSSYPGNSYIGLANQTTITINYALDSFGISVSAGTGGSASANKSSAAPGETITITCTPGTGYSANTPTASGITFTAAGTNKWTFTMPSSAVTVSCTFTKIGYTITKAVNPAGGGTVTTSKTTANYGDTITISQTPASGYYFSHWTISPNITITNNSFVMPAGNVTITANYLKRSTATLNTNSVTGGETAILNIVPEKASYSHKYKLSFGTGMETSLTNVAAGTTSVNISVPLNWSAQIPNATSKGNGTLLLETYNGSTKIGEYTITGLTYNVPASVVPSIGNIATSIVRTIGQTTYANIGEIYTQGKCGVRIQATGSGNQGSTVSSMEVSISGYTDAAYRKTVSGGSMDFTSGLLTVSGTATITVKATDSRGRVATRTANISVTAYNRPNGTLAVWRVDSAGDRDPLGTYGKYSLTKAYTAIGSNTLSWSIKSQSVTENSPGDSGNLLPSSRQTFSQTSEYPIELKLVDAFETVTIIVMLPSAQFMIFLNADGDRMAFMKATNDNLSKNGKDGTIEFSANHQIYIGTTTLEDYIRGVINGTIT